MTNKHIIRVGTMPTVDEFKSNEWEVRKPYVGLTVDKHEVFYNYAPASIPDVGGGYTLATDSDFEWDTSQPMNGAWHYIGTADKVVIPDTINGEKVTSYRGMFLGTSVSGVQSNNPDITDMSWMFYNSQATSLELTIFDTRNVTIMNGMFNGSKSTILDLSSFNTSNVVDMGGIFNDAEITVVYARTQEDINKFKRLGIAPSTIEFKIKS